MGCDIHVYTEVKLNDKWKHIDPLIYNKYTDNDLDYLSTPFEVDKHLFADRNYTLFGLLAGVRSGHVDPIVEPRGIPDDTSDTIRETWELSGEHTPHYYTLAELEKVNIHKLTKSVREDVAYFFYKSRSKDSPIIQLRKIKDRYKVNSEQVRIVFWFDS